MAVEDHAPADTVEEQDARRPRPPQVLLRFLGGPAGGLDHAGRLPVQDRHRGALGDLGRARQRAVDAHGQRRPRPAQLVEDEDAQLVADEERARVLRGQLHAPAGRVLLVDVESGAPVELVHDVAVRARDAHAAAGGFEAVIHAHAPGLAGERVEHGGGVRGRLPAGADVGRPEGAVVPGGAAHDLLERAGGAEHVADQLVPHAVEPVHQEDAARHAEAAARARLARPREALAELLRGRGGIGLHAGHRGDLRHHLVGGQDHRRQVPLRQALFRDLARSGAAEEGGAGSLLGGGERRAQLVLGRDEQEAEGRPRVAQRRLRHAYRVGGRGA